MGGHGEFFVKIFLREEIFYALDFFSDRFTAGRMFGQPSMHPAGIPESEHIITVKIFIENQLVAIGAPK
jgi:hypothetical protein